MDDKIRFSLPLARDGMPTEFIAYESQRRKDTFIVAECASNVRGRKPIMAVFTPSLNHARYELPNFIVVKFTALRDEDDGNKVIAIEAEVMGRGIDKFKARYSMTDCDSEILYNRWGRPLW